MRLLHVVWRRLGHTFILPTATEKTETADYTDYADCLTMYDGESEVVSIVVPSAKSAKSAVNCSVVAVGQAAFHYDGGNRKAETADYADYADCLTMYDGESEVVFFDFPICGICEICGFVCC